MAAATSRFLDKIQGRLNCIYQEDTDTKIAKNAYGWKQTSTPQPEVQQPCRNSRTKNLIQVKELKTS